MKSRTSLASSCLNPTRYNHSYFPLCLSIIEVEEEKIGGERKSPVYFISRRLQFRAAGWKCSSFLTNSGVTLDLQAGRCDTMPTAV